MIVSTTRKVMLRSFTGARRPVPFLLQTRLASTSSSPLHIPSPIRLEAAKTPDTSGKFAEPASSTTSTSSDPTTTDRKLQFAKMAFIFCFSFASIQFSLYVASKMEAEAERRELIAPRRR